MHALWCLAAAGLLATAPAEPLPVTSWPAADAPLTVPEISPRGVGERRLRVYLDAGHGAPGNEGAYNVRCQAEETFTLLVAAAVKTELERTGRFVVRVSRSGDARPRYPARLKEAEAWRADVLVSLHSDARGVAEWWTPSEGLSCLRNDSTPGFAILWSDDAPAPLRLKRSRVSTAVALRMAAAGFLPYDGVDYPGLYDADGTPGSFVDRHLPGARIFMLRRPKIPSIIVETHHALDLEEATRWSEPRTWSAFSAALGAGLIDALGAPALAAGVTTAVR